MPAVTTKKHPYNEDLRVVYVDGQVWENVAKKQALKIEDDDAAYRYFAG